MLHNLELVLCQDHPNYEVIVVDDASTDGSIHLIRAFQKNYPHLRVVTVLENERYILSKKYALTLGIKAARHERLVLTDADCRPLSNQWLRNMASYYVKGKNMVLGFGGYKRDRGVLNALIRLDTAQIALNYMGMARIGNAIYGCRQKPLVSQGSIFREQGIWRTSASTFG